MFCVSLYFAFMSVVKYGKMRLLDWRLDFMMKMLIELDENKILQDGKYSLSKMNSYISNAFEERNMIKESGKWYTNGTFASCGSLALILSSKDWFMDNVQKWLWYDDEDCGIEDLKAHYSKGLLSA